uniref:Uncharacterized protein n=1 Tax=Arundo donax TaxID=35708 RepID=A0A0A8XWI0_ARUDO
MRELSFLFQTNVHYGVHFATWNSRQKGEVPRTQTGIYTGEERECWRLEPNALKTSPSFHFLGHQGHPESVDASFARGSTTRASPRASTVAPFCTDCIATKTPICSCHTGDHKSYQFFIVVVRVAVISIRLLLLSLVATALRRLPPRNGPSGLDLRRRPHLLSVLGTAA